jgi:zinc ribbon protein
MSLIQCSECGKNLSDRAAACPNCGQPSHAVPIPAVVSVEKNSHPILTFIGGAVVVVGGLAIVGAVMEEREGQGPAAAPKVVATQISMPAPAVPPPAARFIVTDVLMDENCTEIGDYCVNVHCTYQNVGNAAGARRVSADLEKGNGNSVAVHDSNLTLLTGATQRVTFNFKEAILDDSPYTAVCRAGEDKPAAGL